MHVGTVDGSGRNLWGGVDWRPGGDQLVTAPLRRGAGPPTIIPAPALGSGMADVLSDEEVDEQLPEGWERDGDEIVRVFEFDDYMKGVNFAQLTGEIAEAQNHHPEMTIRYKELEIRFTTHDAGGITGNDIEMAEILNAEH